MDPVPSLNMRALSAWNRTIQTLAEIPHCEGIASGPDGALWAADEVGKLFRIDPTNGSATQVTDVGGFSCGLCLDAAGYIFVCVYDRNRVVRVDPDTGEVGVYCESVEDGGQLYAPNWCLFADDGTLFVSDSCREGADIMNERTGRVVAVPAGGGKATVVPSPDIGYSNGMALDRDGTLYVIETFVTPRILALRGGDVSVYADLPGTVPDGLALDEEGGVFVSCFQPNIIGRIPHEGGPFEIVADDWSGMRLLTPTNIAFYGPDNRRLAIASLGGMALYTMETPWRGLPLRYPRIPNQTNGVA